MSERSSGDVNQSLWRNINMTWRKRMFSDLRLFILIVIFCLYLVVVAGTSKLAQIITESGTNPQWGWVYDQNAGIKRPALAQPLSTMN